MIERDKAVILGTNHSKLIFFGHQILFSLASGLAATCVIFSVTYRHAFRNFDERSHSKAITYWYFLLRAAFRSNTFLGQDPKNSIGINIATLTIALGVGFAAFLVSGALVKTRMARTLFDPIAGSVISSIFPLAIILLTHVTYPGDPSEPILLEQRHSFMLVILLAILAVSGFFYLTRKWLYPIWIGMAFIAAYFGFFAWVYYGRYSWLIWRAFTELSFLNIVFLIVCPLAALAWLFYARAVRQNFLPIPPYPWKPILLHCLPWFIFLIVPWLPARNYSVAHPKYLGTVNIMLERGSCFGLCPAYTVRLDSTGSVRYDGQLYVRTKGPENITIPRERVSKLLQNFDREHFFSMEDEAFLNGDDAPFMRITISVDGRTKTVTGDTFYSGAWPKSGLYKLAQEIDDAAETSQWVICHGIDCVRR